MTGQQLYQRIHHSFCRKEPMYNRALQDHLGKNLDIQTLLRTISVSYWILENRRSIKFRRTCTGRFWNKQRQENSVLLTRVAIGSMPRLQALHAHEEPS